MQKDKLHVVYGTKVDKESGRSMSERRRKNRKNEK